MLNREDIGETKMPSSGLPLIEFLEYWERGNATWQADEVMVADMREDLAEFVDVTKELLGLIDELKQLKGGAS